MKIEKKEKIGIVEILKIAGKSLKVSLNIRSKLSLFISLIGFCMAFVPVVISTTLRRFTDDIQELFGTGSGNNIYIVLSTFAVLASLFVIQTLYRFVQSYFAEADIIDITRYIKESIIRYTCRVKYKYIENYDNFTDKIVFADTEAGKRVAGSVQASIIWLQNLITFVSIALVLIEVNAFIVVVLLITTIPAIILSSQQKDEEYVHKTKYMLEGHLLIHYFLLCVGAAEQGTAMNEVKYYGLFDYLKKRWKDISDIYKVKKNKMTGKHVLYNSYADIFRNCVYIGVLLLTVHAIFTNPVLGLGTFMLVFTLTGQMQDVTTKLFIGVTQFLGDVSYMKDFFALESLEMEKAEEGARPLDNADIRFENVNFTYPDSTVKVLKDINVEIKQGEKIAIVGENGSGKTTFVNLLCGIYEPDSGRVMFNGTDIRENLTSVRRSISVVLQEFGRYETNIRENITVSDKNRVISDDELMQLAKQTGTFEFIESQPEKLYEMLGIFSNNGNSLSGGQWQKIAITRALYRSKARIMVLDEPTAALDPIAEAQLYRDFSALTGDKTTVLISHRLGITSVIDRILVFDNGRIIEDGSHVELMSKNGLYTKMYRAQAQWYDKTIAI